MKKFLVAIIVFLLAVIAVLLYNIFNNTPVRSAPGCSENITMNYTGVEWKSNVSVDDARLMAGNYREDYGKSRIWTGETRGETADARSAWFPLETLKRFIWNIETSNCKNNCKDSLGIRIYYAKYPDLSNTEFWNEGTMGTQSDFALHHTIFMVPTYFTNRFHQDFNPFTDVCHQKLTEVGNPEKPSKAILTPGDEQNHGSLIPPNAPEGASFINE